MPSNILLYLGIIIRLNNNVGPEMQLSWWKRTERRFFTNCVLLQLLELVVRLFVCLFPRIID